MNEMPFGFTSGWKVEDSNFFEDGTKLKIYSQIKLPLNNAVFNWVKSHIYTPTISRNIFGTKN